jgi:lactose/L-arabinose transport system ATP-binding protein
MNFVAGTVRRGAVEVPALGATLPVSVVLPSEGAKVIVGLRPEHIEIGPGEAATVDLTEALGGMSYAYLTTGAGEKLIVEERGDMRSSDGDRVGLSIDPERVFLFDAMTEARLR